MVCCSALLRRTRRRLAVAGLVFAGACADQSQSPTAVPPVTDSPSASLTAAQEVARGLALGMSDREARIGVRDVLRASRVVEHKVVLQDFINTREGQRLLDAAAAAGADRQRLTKLITELPAMDFYAPFRDHRVAWRGTADVLVGATMNVDELTLTAFDGSGVATELDARNGVPRKTLFLLHPAEIKIERADAAGLPPSEVIQNEREAETAWAIVDPAGGPLEGMAAPPPPPPDTTYLEKFAIHFGDGWGSSEVEFRTSFYGGTFDPGWCCSYTYRQTGVDSYREYTVNAPVSFRVPRWAGSFVNVNVYETDAFQDDWYGFREVSQPGAYLFPGDPFAPTEVETIFYFSSGTNPPRVTRVTVSPSSTSLSIGSARQLVATAYDQNNNVMNWKTFTWSSSNTGVATVASTDYNTANATAVGGGIADIYATTDGVRGSSRVTVPTPGLYVSITGPTKVKPYVTCGYWASASGGSGNYSYTWNTGTTGTELLYTNDGYSYQVSVSVIDNSTGMTGSASRSVIVHDSHPVCMY